MPCVYNEQEDALKAGEDEGVYEEEAGEDDGVYIGEEDECVVGDEEMVFGGEGDEYDDDDDDDCTF